MLLLDFQAVVTLVTALVVMATPLPATVMKFVLNLMTAALTLDKYAVLNHPQ